MTTERKEGEQPTGTVVALLELSNAHILVRESSDGGIVFENVDFSYNPLKIMRARKTLPSTAVIELKTVPLEALSCYQTTNSSPQVTWHERISGMSEPTIQLPVQDILHKKPDSIALFEQDLWSLILPNGSTSDPSATFCTIDSAGHDLVAIVLRREKPVVIFVRAQNDGIKSSIISGLRMWLERIRLALIIRATPIEKDVDSRVYAELGSKGRVSFTADQTNPDLASLHREIYRLQALFLTMKAEQSMGNQALKDPTLLQHAPYLTQTAEVSALKRFLVGEPINQAQTTIVDGTIWSHLNRPFDRATLISTKAEPQVQRLLASLAVSQARKEAERQAQLARASQTQQTPNLPPQQTSAPVRPNPTQPVAVLPRQPSAEQLAAQQRAREQALAVQAETERISREIQRIQTELNSISQHIGGLSLDQCNPTTYTTLRGKIKTLAKSVSTDSATTQATALNSLSQLQVPKPTVQTYKALGIAGPVAYNFLHQEGQNQTWITEVEQILSEARSIITPMYQQTSQAIERTNRGLLAETSELKQKDFQLYHTVLKAMWRVTNLKTTPEFDVAVYVQLQFMAKVIYVVSSVLEQVSTFKEHNLQKATLKLAKEYLTKVAFI